MIFYFFCTLLVFTSSAIAEPTFYITINGTGSSGIPGGNLFKITAGENTVTKIDLPDVAEGKFRDLEKYGDDQLLICNYSANSILIVNLDGTVERTITGLSSVIGAFPNINGTGDIYYANYSNSSLHSYNVTDGTTTLVADFSDHRTTDVIQRTNGDLYVTAWGFGRGIRRVSTDEVIDDYDLAYDMIVDAYDNIMRLGIPILGTYGNGSDRIIKIDTNDNSSVFWQDPTILIHCLDYSENEDCYYGLGVDASDQINIYKFDKSGNATIFQENIQGLTGGSSGLLNYSNIEVIGSSIPATLTLEPDNTSPVIGDTLCIDINLSNAAGLYSSSFDLVFDPTALQYQSASEGSFFNADSGATFFQSALLNGEQSNGIVVMGVSRVGDIGLVSGSGTTATACFSVTGNSGGNTTVSIDNGFFEGVEPGIGIDIVEGDNPVIPVEIGVPQNLVVTDPGTRNRLDLSWDAAPDASGYQVYRADTLGGTFALTDSTSATSYQDSNCILAGVAYVYKVKAFSASGNSTGAFSPEASGAVAGLHGDINKDNRIDGRDLTILAKAFNTDPGDVNYNCQANLDRTDGIDGNDLITISSGFGDQL